MDLSLGQFSQTDFAPSNFGRKGVMSVNSSRVAEDKGPGPFNEFMVDPKSRSDKASSAQKNKPQVVELNEEVLGFTKQTAIQSFLLQMHEELGVEPEQVVMAFLNMDEEALQAAPEDSVDDFIKNLDLNKAAEPEAKKLYNEMLTMTAAASMNEYLRAMDSTAQMEVLSERVSNQRHLDSTLEDMRNRFFRPELTQKNQEPISLEKNMAAPEPEGDKGRGRAYAGAGASAAAMAAYGVKKGNQGADMAKEAASPEGQIKSSIFEAPKMDSQKAVAQMKAHEINAQQNLNKSGLGVEQSGSQGMALGSSAGDFTDGESSDSFMNKDGHKAAFDTQKSTKAQGEEFKIESSDGKAAQATNASLQATKDVKPTFTVTTPEATESDVNENVKEIISRAEFLSRKGGGEMKIQLKPEGLGEVNLKVNSKNGQVSIQMVTQTEETRKILEKGLGDLRHNLMTQKLNVESIRVESSQNTQLADQQQDPQDRSSQERFLQDFQNRNHAFRHGMFDLNPARVPGSQTDGDSVESSDRSRDKRNADRRLDLVA